MVQGGTVEYKVDIDNKSIADSVKEIETGLGKASPKPVAVAAAAQSKESMALFAANMSQLLGFFSQIFANIKSTMESFAQSQRAEYDKTGDKSVLFRAQLADIGAAFARVGEILTTVVAAVVVTILTFSTLATALELTMGAVAAAATAFIPLIALITLAAGSLGMFGESVQVLSNMVLTEVENFFMRVWAAIEDIFWGGLSSLTGGLVEASSAMRDTEAWIRSNSATWEQALKQIEPVSAAATAAASAPGAGVNTPKVNTSVFFSATAIGRLGSLPIQQQISATRDLTEAMRDNTAAMERGGAVVAGAF